MQKAQSKENNILIKNMHNDQKMHNEQEQEKSKLISIKSKENNIRNKKNTFNKMCILELEKDTSIPCGTESILGTTPQSTLNNNSVVLNLI